MHSNKALIFGSTGLIGSHLLKLITADKAFTEVVIFSRKDIEVTTPKTRLVIFDHINWEGVETHFTPNAKVFCCIGTTKAKTPDSEEYRAIDYGIPVKLAEFAARGSCRGFYVVSSLGANTSSMNFYQKTKGEMERDVAKRGVNETYFFRPSLLLGKRSENRPGEQMAQTLSQVISPLMFGPLKRYKGIDAALVAKAMMEVSKNGHPRTVISNEDILKFES